jgi:hypothetical protein
MQRHKEKCDGLPVTFIVRIYCFPGDTRRELVGVVETVGVEGVRRFAGIGELWEILNLREERGTAKP